MLHKNAGKKVKKEDLIDLDLLISAYYNQNQMQMKQQKKLHLVQVAIEEVV